MKKITALLLAVCMVAALMAGCSTTGKTTDTTTPTTPSTDTTTPTTPSTDTTTPTTPSTDPAPVDPIDVSLKVWSPSEDQNPDLGEWVVTMCNQFNELHPEWNITFEYGVASESDAGKMVPQDIDAAADVFLFGSTKLENLCNSDSLTEWGGKYKDAVTANYPASLVDCLTYDGGLYGVPITTDTYFMYYDKSVFTEEDVKSLDTMLTKGKVAFPLANGYYLAAFYLANGCTFFGADGSNRADGIQVGGAKGTAVTNCLVDLVQNENFIVAEPADAISMMREGNCAAYICGTWQATQTKEILGDNFGVAILPSVMIDGVNCQIRPFTSAKAVGVKSTTAYPEVALNLALYLASYEGQKTHYELRGYVPCELKLTAEVQSDPICLVDSETVTKIAVSRASYTEFSYYWSPAESMGTEIRDGIVTHENAAEKTEAFKVAVNSSGIG
ncbi:MAG: extracellular solute-binding protein [Oscillospiraceae bacterium]|nr:extracellular solute-binding protein [Oscillospiraceae bacterium]